MLKVHRSPHEASTQGDLIVARRNPQALWLSDYEDRIVYDGRKRASGASRHEERAREEPVLQTM